MRRSLLRLLLAMPWLPIACAERDPPASSGTTPAPTRGGDPLERAYQRAVRPEPTPP